MDWFNNKHYHSGLNFLTPNSRHNNEDDKIMEHRKKVYESAKQLYPQRFNRGIRNWKSPGKVALNPTDEVRDILKQESAI